MKPVKVKEVRGGEARRNSSLGVDAMPEKPQKAILLVKHSVDDVLPLDTLENS
jgi:hypothetical protein